MSDFDPKDIHEDVTSDFKPEDIHQEVSPEEISKLASAEKGMEQGVTLGHADELSGGIQASLDQIQALMNKQGLSAPSPSQTNADLAAKGFKGDIGPKSTLEMYQKARDENRKKYDDAQKANPKSYLAGNVMGGALTASAMPSALTSPLSGATTVTGKIAQAAANAAPMGAMVGSGVSTADLTKGQVGQYAGDVAKDTGLAGLGAGLISGGTQALQSTVNSSQAKKLLDAYTVAKQKGQVLSGPENLQAAQTGLEDLAKNSRADLTKYGLDKYGAKKAILDTADKAGQKIDIKAPLQEFADQIGTNKSLTPDQREHLSQVVQSYFKDGNSKSPLELEAMIKDINELGQSVEGPAASIVKNLKDKLKAAQETSTPGVVPLNKDISENLSLSENLLGKSTLDKMAPEEMPGFQNKVATKFSKYGTDNTKDITGTQLDIDNVLNKGLPSDYIDPATGLNKQTRSMQELNPDFTNKFKSDLQDKSKVFNLSQTANQPMSIKAPLKSIDTAMVRSGETLGTNAKSIAESTPIKTMKDVATRGTEWLNSADRSSIVSKANDMATSGGKAGLYFAHQLLQASTLQGPQKNTMMFSLMQQPAFRKMLHQTNGNAEKPVMDFSNPNEITPDAPAEGTDQDGSEDNE